jgi:membrane associated rhomboid family serine protease
MAPLPLLRRRVQGILFLIAATWGVLLVNSLLYRFDMKDFGLTPRTSSGLLGVLTMPLLHSQLGHLAANTAPLMVLLTLLAASRARFWETLLELLLLSGLVLWVFGRSTLHVGADALIYALLAFLLLTGLVEKRNFSLLVSFAVGFLYGGMFLWGVVPGLSPKTSWDSNLAGAAAGAVLAFALTIDPRNRRPTTRDGPQRE